MAYSVDDIAEVIAWTHTSGRTNDDTTEDVDTTTCHTNGTTGEDCDEYKDALSCKVAIDVQGGALLVNSKIRFFVNTVMTAGDMYLLAYTDANSVDGASELGPFTLSAGNWMEFTLDSGFIAALAAADGSGFQYVRWASDGTSKPKSGEVEGDMLIDLDTLAGVSRDEDGDPLLSAEVTLLKVVSATEKIVMGRQVSHPSTGAYSFEVAPGQDYMIIGEKLGATDVFDVTAADLQGV